MNDQTNLPAEVAAASPKAIANAGMTPGSAVAALIPQSLDDAYRLSKALAMSGDMVPKHFQQKPDMIMAAVLRGMEIGLAPMQALSNIAVINGRASLWGDALPALMQRAGHHLDCVVTGEGDAMAAVATLIRGDTGKTITRTFSVADAKKAALWGKSGPWQSYPTRMLSMRARSLACRDGAADALMGLQVAEEVQDYPRDVTPAERPMGGFAQKAVAAKAAENSHSKLPGGKKSVADVIAEGERAHYAAEDTKAATTDHIPDAETVAPHWTDNIVWEDAFPGSKEWDAGALAWQDGFPLTECPHQDSPAKAADWLGGWNGARKAAQ